MRTSRQVLVSGEVRTNEDGLAQVATSEGVGERAACMRCGFRKNRKNHGRIERWRISFCRMVGLTK